MAGKDRKSRSDTYSTPRSLVHVAGKPLVKHLLNSVSVLDFDKAIFIVDEDFPSLKKMIEKKHSFKSIFVMQKERRGVAHAILGAKKYVEKDEDVLVLFADTLIETNLKIINKHKDDGIVWTKIVKDPRPYGVAFLHDGYISKLIEKPSTPISDRAIVGMYYFKNAGELFRQIEFLIKNDIKTHGEFQLTDAIQLMIEHGDKLKVADVKTWHDCDTVKNLLETNKYLLKKAGSKMPSVRNSVIIKPDYIDKTAIITNSIIGPNVSIGKGVHIHESVVSESIINEEANISNALLKDSIIGKKTKVEGFSKKLNIGDLAQVSYY